MTNTKNIRLPEDKQKLFRWRKEWVRPYESEYSVVRNFCKVNAVNPRKMFQMFGISTATPFTMYNLRGRANYDRFSNAVFPDDFIDYSHMIDSDIYNIRLCPKCWADGYHSYLHNINGAEECPFHHIPLIDTNIRYSITDSIVFGQKDKTDRYDNALDCILPCERKLTNDYSVELPEISSIIPLRISKEPLRHAIKPFVVIDNSAKLYTIPSFKGTEKEYEEYLINDIDSRNIRFKPLKEINEKAIIFGYKITKDFLKNGRLVYNRRPDIWYEYEALCLFSEYQKYYDKFVKGYRSACDTRDIINSPTINQITAYLIRYISGFRDNWRALDLDWVFHPGSGIHWDRNPYPNLDIMQLVGFNDYHDESTWDYKIIVPKVLEDLFAYLHRQLIEIVNSKGFLDQQNDWKLLKVPEYYAVKYEQESDWTILRYE